ncbi:thiol-disulfide isomerase/thioredoxin [Anoxybacillus voinovskiensis]|uniref:Thiol-disulfide isomerase/thioredoxin n=1 Tax=Anoxybacteroides voinovskiense TaxID=230470 RepID=A0A840DT98_9BACL|nr:TlpA disulfide reductase family protein [Anoxybacillus voinovskiensis]MBB4074893.1 thiol-disulfide isomerase/thioredoxin [Anoxybacillus voinovskiensis]GGJ74809.1 thiol-disulfide oxidoreductase YkuV [Anoxybacillus voinovskiensis]
MKLRELMPDLNGATAYLNGKVTKEQLQDKPTLIHFWAVSCHLCKKAMPQVNELRDRFQNELHVVSIHMPRLASDLHIELVKQTAEEHDITQPILVDNDRKITEAFENQYVPSYYLFDAEGKLRHFQAGGTSMTMLENRLMRLLEENKRSE